MPQNTSTIRISNSTKEIIEEIAAREGRSRSAVLSDAVERYRRERFFESLNDGYTRLKADEKAWKDELRERELWESTSGDALEEA
jgi:predicted transcriptional regulator